jgi:hypothetical protein
MRKERKHYTAEEKVAVLRRHLLDKVPVSDLCEELSLKPMAFYRWQKEFFENVAAAFQAQERPHRQVEEKQKRIEYLGVTASKFYSWRNGKIERWHKSLKRECIRERTPLSLEDAKRLIQEYVDHYNHLRLHSAIGYVTPNDMLLGRQAAIHAERDRKLEKARQQRQLRRGQSDCAGWNAYGREGTV